MKQQALVVDDHPVVRNGIKQLLHRAFPSMFIKESSGTDGVIEEICGDPWSFVTLDLSLPGGQNGLHIIRQINSCCPQIPIIVFSLFSEEEYGPRALRSGAVAYVSKDRSPLALVEAIKSALAGKLDRGISPPTVPLPILSNREIQVLKHLAKGTSRHETAQAIGIAEKTVATYRARLLQKLGARTNVDLIRHAVEDGLIEEERH